jgi:hypothetical protein
MKPPIRPIGKIFKTTVFDSRHTVNFFPLSAFFTSVILFNQFKNLCFLNRLFCLTEGGGGTKKLYFVRG